MSEPVKIVVSTPPPTVIKVSNTGGGGVGSPGPRGKSAYELAPEAGFVGTVSDWLQSLHGDDGDVGPSAYEVAVNDGFAGDVTAWLASLKGDDGDDGDDGDPGPPGKSAYEVAVENGFSGDVTAWLASLEGSDGDDGDSAYAVAVAEGFVGSKSDWLASLKGEPGADAPVMFVVPFTGGSGITKPAPVTDTHYTSVFGLVDYASDSSTGQATVHRDGTLSSITVAFNAALSNNATARSYTVDLIINGQVAGTVTVSGASGNSSPTGEITGPFELHEGDIINAAVTGSASVQARRVAFSSVFTSDVLPIS